MRNNLNQQAKEDAEDREERQAFERAGADTEEDLVDLTGEERLTSWIHKIAYASAGTVIIVEGEYDTGYSLKVFRTSWVKNQLPQETQTYHFPNDLIEAMNEMLPNGKWYDIKENMVPDPITIGRMD